MKILLLDKDKILKWIKLCNESKDPADEIIRVKCALRAGFNIDDITLLINATWIERRPLREHHWHTPFGIVADDYRTLSWKDYEDTHK